MYANEYLINRPSRIRYRMHFESLPEEVIDEVIADLLQHKEYIESIRSVLFTVRVVTFDLLITLIKEVDLFNEPATMVASYLNIIPEEIKVNIIEIWKGKPYTISTNIPFKNNSEWFNFYCCFFLQFQTQNIVIKTRVVKKVMKCFLNGFVFLGLKLNNSIMIIGNTMEYVVNLL